MGFQPTMTPPAPEQPAQSPASQAQISAAQPYAPRYFSAALLRLRQRVNEDMASMVLLCGMMALSGAGIVYFLTAALLGAIVGRFSGDSSFAADPFALTGTSLVALTVALAGAAGYG